MNIWLADLPAELKYYVRDVRGHNFYKGLLHCQYYAILLYVYNTTSKMSFGSEIESRQHSSWSLLYQAALMISRIMENMVLHNEMMNCPPYIGYFIFSAMAELVCHLKSCTRPPSEFARGAIETCIFSLEEISKTWDQQVEFLQIFRKFLRKNVNNKQQD
jgi:hypothetical protein